MQDVFIPKISTVKYRDARRWCFDNFGEEAWYIQHLEIESTYQWFAESKSDPYTGWGDKTYTGKALFSFRHREDALAFSLLWA